MFILSKNIQKQWIFSFQAVIAAGKNINVFKAKPYRIAISGI